MTLASARPLDLLWGKADPTVFGGWHPATLHMLDVAAVALELLEEGLARSLASDLRNPAPGTTLEAADLAFLVACHDVGKLTPGFQVKSPWNHQAQIDAGFDFPELSEARHALATTDLLGPLLEGLGMEPEAAARCTLAVGAHHGTFLQIDERRATRTKSYGNASWSRVRQDAVRVLGSVLGADPSKFSLAPGDAWSMALAGIVVVADWVGSDPTYFPYQPGRSPSASYVTESRQRAARALSDLGWRGWRPRTGLASWSDVFPGFEPNAVQRLVIEVTDKLDAPGLVLIEAPTGSGKTEAALYAAESQIARFGLGGMYFALPTQAASNQMFGRVRDFLRRRYPEEHVNLHLLHGQRDLQADYATIRARSIHGNDQDAAVVADAWFTGKRRGLLSPFAVGTVDQAMLAALESRFFHLRMLGLSRKVLVIDEVHAYDTFMSRILDRLLAWLSAQGSSVVLLSATLPAARRRELLDAYSGGSTAMPVAYPRVCSTTPRSPVSSCTLEHEGPTPEVALEWREGDAAATARALIEELTEGGCAAWICNTVGAAQNAYRALTQAGLAAEELILFHARFPSEQRLRLEAQVLGAIARGTTRPARLVVVATQVLEQSLDLDFDLLVTELAPVDLLIQRAGRLHRHPERDPLRPRALRTPTVWLTVDHGNDPPTFGASASVYHEHVLLRTWWALRRRAVWRPAVEADELLALVYAPLEPPAEATSECARAWRSSARDLEETLARASMSGARQLVPPPSPIGADETALERLSKDFADPDDDPTVHRDLLARTRDIESSVTIVCLHQGVDGVVVSATDATQVDLDGGRPSAQLVSQLVRRSISLQHRRWVAILLSLDVPGAWRRVPQLRTTRAVVFDRSGRAVVAGRPLLLDPTLGLLLDQGGQRT